MPMPSLSPFTKDAGSEVLPLKLEPSFNNNDFIAAIDFPYPYKNLNLLVSNRVFDTKLEFYATGDSDGSNLYLYDTAVNLPEGDPPIAIVNQPPNRYVFIKAVDGFDSNTLTLEFYPRP